MPLQYVLAYKVSRRHASVHFVRLVTFWLKGSFSKERDDNVNELVQLVQQKTGLSQDAAEKAVDPVMGFIKQKLPAPMTSGVDSVLGEGAQAAAATGGTTQTAAAVGAEKVTRMIAEAKELVGGISGRRPVSCLTVNVRAQAPVCTPLATRISGRRRSVA